MKNEMIAGLYALFILAVGVFCLLWLIPSAPGWSVALFGAAAGLMTYRSARSTLAAKAEAKAKDRS